MTPEAVGFWALEGEGFLWIAVTVIWVCGLLDLMLKRPDLDGRHRAAWILSIVLLPVIGTLAYFFTRPTLPREREQMIAARQAREATQERHGQVPPAV